MLATESVRDNNLDVFSMLFKTTRGSSAKDLWARSELGYKAQEEEAMLAKGWTPAMPRSESFPMKMSVRAKLFEALDEQVKEEWREFRNGELYH